MRSRRGAAAGALLGLLLTGCTAPQPPAGPAPAPAPTGTAGPPGTPATASPTDEPSAEAEPTTTNTLPPPPAPTAPAPSVAGPLHAADLPVPAGWRTAVRPGGAEQGFRGNGTWVHARDPRYAAYETVAVGCAAVTRDDYPDPVAALEGDYRQAGGGVGVGLVLEFADPARAGAWFAVYREQVAACTDATEPLRTALLPAPGGLIDRRHYADGGRWTEIAAQHGRRIRLVALSPGRGEVSERAARAVLRDLTG